jgi:Holliday junction DNA helicase RuvA
MIAYLKGRVINKTVGGVIINVSDIGYQVFVGETFWAEIKIGQELEIYTHHHVREEAEDLYGFKSLDDLELFDLLLSVSGVGPKSALAVISLAATNDIKEAIIRGDASLLMKVSGIGKKTAERLVLELKNKVTRLGSGLVLDNSLSSASFGDEMDALISLGYSFPEAREALNLINPDLTDSGERVKAALKKLAH